MRTSRTKKPGGGSRARAKRPGAVQARKGSGNGEKRGGLKSAHSKPRVASKPARRPKVARAAQPAAVSAKDKDVSTKSKAALAAQSEAAAAAAPPSPAPRGNPPPLPAAIASFNF